MIKAIIFDCFGVLTGDSWLEFLHTADPELRVQIKDIHTSFDNGFLGYPAFRSQLMELSGQPAKVFDSIFLTHASSGRNKNVLLLNYIQELHANYKTGVLSNVGTSWIRDEFLTTEEAAMFDDMVLSFEVGLSKPDPKLYELACQRLDVTPEEAVFVDDRQDFCKVAENVGMQPIVYTNFTQFKHQLNTILTDTNY